MDLDEAMALLAPAIPPDAPPAVWADLGCGTGTFTRALARLLPPGSVVHALDQDASVLRSVERHLAGGVRVVTAALDVVAAPWPFPRIDGILMANLLHFVRDQASLVAQARRHLAPEGRLVIVEYDTDEADRWVPHPVSRGRLSALLAASGFPQARLLGEHPSLYRRRGPIYSVEARRGTDLDS